MKTKDFASFWRQIEKIIKSLPSTDIVFNQYRDCNAEVDLPNGPSIRLANLRAYMAKATETASMLVVGEAAGPWGCRFSGVPFTGERQLLDPSFPFSGCRSSRTVPSCLTKVDPPFISRSAETFWEVMLPYHGHFVVWDAFPLHPHVPGDVLTVRNPTKKEVSEFGEALHLIKAYILPTFIIAVGKKAYEELAVLGETPIYVRHPSRGGKSRFTCGMEKLFTNQEQKR